MIPILRDKSNIFKYVKAIFNSGAKVICTQIGFTRLSLVIGLVIFLTNQMQNLTNHNLLASIFPHIRQYACTSAMPGFCYRKQLGVCLLSLMRCQSFVGHLNPLNYKSDWLLIFPYIITLKSNIKVRRKKEVITNQGSYWLIDKFSLLAPQEMYREQNGEYAHWC